MSDTAMSVVDQEHSDLLCKQTIMLFVSGKC